MKVMVLGASGKVGWALRRELNPIAEISAFGRSELDITDSDRLASEIVKCEPDVVVNAAAYTNVGGAETDPLAAKEANGHAVGVLGKLAAERDAVVVHFSTDFVFDGATTTPYREEAPTNPLNVYGASKLLGEKALIESGAPSIILRTAWLFAAAQNNFVASVIGRARAGDELRIVDDQVGCPTSVPVLATAVRIMLSRSRDSLAKSVGQNPVFHLTCRGQASWHDLAVAALSEAGLGEIEVSAITTAQSGSAVQRPAYSVLDCTRFESTFGVWLPHWRAALGPIARTLA